MADNYTGTEWVTRTKISTEIMSQLDEGLKKAINATGGIHYGTCSTSYSTAAKVISCDDVDKLSAGLAILVNFSDYSTANSPTLNVNSLGAKNIYVNGTTASSSNYFRWGSSAIILFVYDGSYWRPIGMNDSYYGTSSTAESTTAKTSSISNFMLHVGVSVTIKMSYANTASAPTLNVSSTGAFTIKGYIDWDADDYITFVFGGGYWNAAKTDGSVDDDKYALKEYYGDDYISLGRDTYYSVGKNSTAVGNMCRATGDYSHAEGYSAATGDYSHSEGWSSANNAYSHSEGWSAADGYVSHAEGGYNYAEADFSHAEGGGNTVNDGNTADGISSHVEGVKNTTTGKGSHAEGSTSIASGDYSHAEGGLYSGKQQAIGYASHAEGSDTTVYSLYGGHAEGWGTTAGESGVSSYSDHAEGYGSKSYGYYGSHAEGYYTEASGNYGSHAEGAYAIAEAAISHAEGYGSSTSGYDYGAHAEGYCCTAGSPWSGYMSGDHAEGCYTTANGSYGSHAEGYGTKTTGYTAHAEGWETVAASYAHAEGVFSEANQNNHAMGHYNNDNGAGSFSGTSGDYALTLGNGKDGSLSNAFRVTYGGKVFALSAFNSSGADYAEFIKEWADGNPDNEDRVGYFVTVKDGYLVKAEDGDYIVGITSGNPSVVGNSDEDYYWRYERDEFDRIIFEDIEETEPTLVNVSSEKMESVTPVDGACLGPGSSAIQQASKIEVKLEMLKTGNIIENGAMKLAEDYDSSLQSDYIHREDRPEWDYVGMIGTLPVRDDGTCEVGKLCKCGSGGIATLSETRGFDTYLVIERVTENVVKVIMK